MTFASKEDLQEAIDLENKLFQLVKAVQSYPEQYMPQELLSDLCIEAADTQLLEAVRAAHAAVKQLVKQLDYHLSQFKSENTTGRFPLLHRLLERLPEDMKVERITSAVDCYEITFDVAGAAFVSLYLPQECAEEDWDRLIDYTIYNARTQAAIISGDNETVKAILAQMPTSGQT